MEDKKRLPINAKDPETWKKPEDMTWGDKALAPNRPLSHRQRELCRMAAHGKMNKEIAEKLNYTQARVSVLLSNSRIKDEIERYRDALFKQDEKTRIKELTPDALNVMEQILVDRNLDLKDKENAARWILEKATGKAAQQIEANHTINIGDLYDKLDQMKVKEKTRYLPESEGTEIIDVEPISQEEQQEVDDFASWLEDNL